MGSDPHRAYLTRLCCALRLSQPLSALFHPKPSRPCFMPAALMGFGTLQSFPLPRIELPLSFPSHLDVAATLETPRPFPVSCFSAAPRLHGFNPPGSPFIRHPVLPGCRSRCSPGIHPLQGVLPRRLRRRLHAFFLLRTSGKISPRKDFHPVP
jgi:hypothetical protein